MSTHPFTDEEMSEICEIAHFTLGRQCFLNRVAQHLDLSDEYLEGLWFRLDSHLNKNNDHEIHPQ